MMNYLWAIFILVSLVVSLFTGKIGETSAAAMDSAKEAVETAVSILGVMCFWMGLMQIADKSGLIQKFSKLMSPVIGKLFKGVKKQKTKDAILMNMAANLLGIGNAATPLGLKAMEEMERENSSKGVATNDMALFVVLNTASLQLIPATLLAFRSNFGSTKPFEILPCVWIASILSVASGIIAAKILEKRKK